MDKSSSRVLVVEADDLLRENLRAHFVDVGYQVTVAATGKTGVEQAQNEYPSLILLALNLPDMPGREAFRALRSQPRTGHIPVMVLAGRDDSDFQKALLEEGAYDFIEKPLDLDILTLRVRNALRRAEREGLAEGRTGLPTGRLIDERLAALEGQTGWFRIDLSIAEFDTFRDQYGFVTANEALRHTGNQVRQIVNEQGGSGDFVGHRSNTESFVILTTQARGARLRAILEKRLTEELKSFYNFMERDQGYVLVDDGAGGQTQKPLMSPEMTVEQGPPDPNAPEVVDDPWEDALDAQTPESDSPDDSDASSAFDW